MSTVSLWHCDSHVTCLVCPQCKSLAGCRLLHTWSQVRRIERVLALVLLDVVAMELAVALAVCVQLVRLN